MKITVVGGGWGGVVSAVCYAEFGFCVEVVDANEKRIEDLKNNITPFYEPGLDELIQRLQDNGDIKFSNNSSDFCANDSNEEIIAIAMGIVGANGEDSDLTALYEVISDISLNLRPDKYVAIIIKSTVPVGTCSIIKRNIKFVRPDLTPGEHYDIISNPSFIREGAAIHDFMNPEKVIIGIDHESKKAKEVVLEIYKSMVCSNVPFVFTDFDTAELIRYATTGFVVTKIAFMNELAELCNRIGADVNMLSKGVGLDTRVGPKLLKVSPGFGGSSYPRNARILVETANTLGVELNILKEVIKSNNDRIQSLTQRVLCCLEDENGVAGKNVSVLGLSFKAQTDDISESTSIVMIKGLLKSGVNVFAYDPMYKPSSKKLNSIPEEIRCNNRFSVTSSVYEAASQSDALVLVTDWMEFRGIDFGKILELMNKKIGAKPLFVDFRNMFSSAEMKEFEYISQG